MQVMGDISCVPGLFVAGVFSGALSTVSSGLNSLAAVTLQDLMNTGCKVSFSEQVFSNDLDEMSIPSSLKAKSPNPQPSHAKDNLLSEVHLGGKRVGRRLRHPQLSRCISREISARRARGERVYLFSYLDLAVPQ